MKHLLKQSILLLSFVLMSSKLLAGIVIEGITYNLNHDLKWASVTYDSIKYSGDIIIPSTVTYNDETFQVSTISGDAFANCRELTSISIPESVTIIEGFAFYNCM